MRQLTDSLRMSGDIDLELRTHDLNFVKALAGSGAMDGIALPSMRLDGKVGLRGQEYTADLRLRESQGTVRLKAGLDAARMAYQARLDVRNLHPQHFLPKDSLYNLNLTAEAQGRGTDFFSRRTRLQAGITLDSLQYKEMSLSGMGLSARGTERGRPPLTATTRCWT